jgi:PAS domain S-box-containing protein
MLVDTPTANHLIDEAVAAASDGPATLAAALNHMAAPMYVTDEHGTITHFNDACVALAGRTPAVGQDKWCVTWKLFTLEGEPLPHDQCPMAIAVRERRPIRNAQALAERPDGTRFAFTPYPSPLFDDEGQFTGAVNLLAEAQEFRVEFSNDVANGPVSVTFTANSLSEALERLASPPVQPIQLWCEGKLLGRLELRGGHSGVFWRLA